MRTVDLNCDMGEGFPDDAALMDYVSSVNVACGFHAGDYRTMRLTVETALRKGLAIGAHPGYPDRENFGRLPMNLKPGEVYDLVAEQIETLESICNACGTRLSHVKPHGALYNQAAGDARIAAAIAKAVKATGPELVLYGLSGSQSIAEGEKAGLRTASEAFADRTYRLDGSLTPRSESNALIADPADAASQAVGMVREGNVKSADGSDVPITADTICIHGDAPHALEFAKAIHSLLTSRDIQIRPIVVQ